VSLPIRDELRGLKPYGAPQLDVPIKLNTNENPFSPPAELIAEIAREVAAISSSLNRYPDRDAVELRQALCDYVCTESGGTVKPSQVWAANGSNEVMIQILQAFGGPGRTALTFAPTYSMYEEYARDTNTGFVTVNRAEDFSLRADTIRTAVAQHKPSVVFITNPNNPTGTMLDIDAVAPVFAEFPDTLFVLDEAYAEFRRAHVKSAVQFLALHPNLIVTRTMSKAFAFAGVRLGYLVASKEIIEALMLVRLPYHLSTVTQTVAACALRHAAALQKDLDVLRVERDHLVDWLRSNGFTAADSDANFVLFGQFPDRHAVWQALVDRGVLIREVGPDGWLRVTVGTPSEMNAFKQALLESTGKAN
jgi:histidinol-phosphate aminotransferase